MKIGFSTILALVGFVLVFLGFTTQAGIAPLVIGFILLLVGASVFGIIHLGKHEEKSTRILNGLIWGITLLMALNATGIISASSVPTASIPSIPSAPKASGASITGAWNFYPSGSVGATYAGSGIVYLMDESVLTGSDNPRYTFMKKIQDGKTAEFTLNSAASGSMSVSSGAFTKNQLSTQIGKRYWVAGYTDNTPAFGENVSFAKMIEVTGANPYGNTPEINWKFVDTEGTNYQWYNYAQIASLMDTNEVYRSNYTENQSSSVEKTFTFVVEPYANGQQMKDVALYIELPSANAGAITKVTMLSSDSLQSAEYTSLQSTSQMSSSDPRFIAAPTLTTATDTMYYVGTFPSDDVRTSTSDLAKTTVSITYNHPATAASVLVYPKLTFNSGAYTVSGGHGDYPTTAFTLNWSAGTGVSAWNTSN